MVNAIRKILKRTTAIIGQPFVNASLVAYDNVAIAGQALAVAPKAILDFSNVVGRFDVLVLQCVRLVASASFAAGAVMALQFGQGMGRFGATTYVPTVVTNSILEALAPMLAVLMAAARSGGGLAAEIAGMVVTQQVDAIRALGSDPARKLHAPSILVLIIGLPLLTIVADVSGLAGGLLIEITSLNLPPSQAIAKTIDAVQIFPALLAILKTSVAGAVIGIIAIREGMRAHGGTSGIGQATTSAVVKTTLGVLIADLILTKIIWLTT